MSEKNPTPEQVPRILSFEEFSTPKKRFVGPPYNNFYIYFFPGDLGMQRRKRADYVRFVKENTGLEEDLREKMQELMKKKIAVIHR